MPAPFTIAPPFWALIEPVHLFSMLCVGVYAWNRFRTPPDWQLMTTRLQWKLSLYGYVMAAILLWALVALTITAQPDALAFLSTGTEGAAAGIESLDELAAPFASALFLTVLLPNLPLLCRIDDAIQRAFRELGAIPRNARQLSAAVRRADFAVPVSLRNRVHRELADQGLDPESIFVAPAHSPAWDWIRIVSLRLQLHAEFDEVDALSNTAERLHGGSGCLRHLQEECQQASAAYRRLAALAGTIFPRQASGGSLSRARGRFGALRSNFDQEAGDLLRSLSHVVSCGLLSRHNSVRDARNHLRGWGFDVREVARPPLLGWHEVVGLALGIMVYDFVLFLAKFGEPEPLRVFQLAVLISLVMTGALVAAGIPRRIFRRPVQGTIGVGPLGTTCSQPLSPPASGRLHIMSTCWSWSMRASKRIWHSWSASSPLL